MRTAFIQLCRFGDIVSILPIAREKAMQGHDVSIYVSPQYAEILEPVGYVTPIIHGTHARDVEGAVDAARRAGFDEIVVTQGCPLADAANFQAAQWMRAGCFERFHDLPLVFDKRDPQAEAAVLAAHLPPPDGRPLLAYSLGSHSSFFAQSEAFARWVEDELSRDYCLLDLTYCPIRRKGRKLDKVHHLLPLLDAADVLITSHSLPLMLSYASQLPTVALGPDADGNGNRWRAAYCWAEPRRHWIARASYEEAMTPAGREKIAQAVHARLKQAA